MHSFYSDYWSQEWYSNTFLVNDPTQVGQAINGDDEWNSVAQSGCHFTCLAMILGLDPAYLASTLSKQEYFGPDAKLRTIGDGTQRGPFIWDRNAPNVDNPNLKIRQVWHPRFRQVLDIDLRHIATSRRTSLSSGIETTLEAIGRGNHIVCGPTNHSVLVAGISDNGAPFIWDPNPQKIPISNLLAGKYTMKRLFSERGKSSIYFHEYSASVA